MSILDIFNNKNFEEKDQFQKRKLLKKYILKEKDCKVGIRVICFEKETIIDEKHKYFYRRYGKSNTINSLTIGKTYTIIDFRNDKIKIENDLGKKLWYTTNRFLYSLKILRKEKLEKIKIQ